MIIHQMLPSYSCGDAIGNCVTQMRLLLREWGHQSEVFAEFVHPALEGRDYREFAGEDPEAVVIYHYSTGSPVNRYALENAENIVLMYHNITPAEYFANFDEKAAENCRSGRQVLKRFAGRTQMAMAASPYNAGELETLGIGPIRVVPCIFDVNEKKRFGAVKSDDGKTNMLCVGRIAPHKRIEDVLKIFYFYRKYVDTNSTLTIAGGYSHEDRYYRYLESLIDKLEIPDVVFTGFLSEEELGQCFGSADLFVLMSRHEGLGIPLLEAMSFGLPVVALAGTGVTQTMGGAGALVRENRPERIAELIGIIMEDDSLRKRIVEGQNRRLADFTKEKMISEFRQAINTIEHQHG